MKKLLIFKRWHWGMSEAALVIQQQIRSLRICSVKQQKYGVTSSNVSIKKS